MWLWGRGNYLLSNEFCWAANCFHVLYLKNYYKIQSKINKGNLKLEIKILNEKLRK